MNQDQKLERFAERELRKNIDKLIIEDDEGGLIAFGKYYVKSSKTQQRNTQFYQS